MEDKMASDARAPRSYVTGPDGNVLTLENLPAANTRRWVARKKAQIVAAVRGGLLSLGEACERYGLTPEEFLNWQSALEHFGLGGLRATDTREHRHP
jgi:transposase-like protein